MRWIDFHGEARVREAVAGASCFSDALRTLGLRAAGGNHKTIKRACLQLGIDTSHFDRDIGRKRAAVTRLLPLDELLVERSRGARQNLKRRLFAEGLKERKCELCGQGEEWRGRSMSLILDHINGIHDDNRLENLQIVCPNCAATLETHCGRKTPRRGVCATCASAFTRTRFDQRFCSLTCAAVEHADRTRGVPQPHTRKVPRPSYPELLADVAAMSMSAVGRKHGVSDNAVRKWVRAYERETARRVHDDEAA